MQEELFCYKCGGHLEVDGNDAECAACDAQFEVKKDDDGDVTGLMELA